MDRWIKWASFAVNIILFIMVGITGGLLVALAYIGMIYNGGLFPSEKLQSIDGDHELRFPNLRFSTSNISYGLAGCSEEDREDMVKAFEIIQNNTVVHFNEQNIEPKIKVVCARDKPDDEDYYLTLGQAYTSVIPLWNHVLISGAIITLYESEYCMNDQPFLQLHELLHAFGFNHVEDSSDIMYWQHHCGELEMQPYFDMINKIYNSTIE